MLMSGAPFNYRPIGARQICHAPDGRASVAVAQQSNWLGLHRPAQGLVRARLMILPFAGGNASAFFSWLKEMGGEDWLEIAVVQPPGRGTRFRDPPMDSLDVYAGAVAKLAQTLSQQYGYAPLLLMGYSMGALVAYLTALKFGQQLPLRHLIVAARKAPQHHRTSTADEPMSHDAVLARLRRLQGTPESLLQNKSLIEPYLDSISAEFHMVDSYVAKDLGVVAVPITAISGLRDPETPTNQVFGWQSLTTASFTAHFLPGGHFFMNTVGPEFQQLVLQLTQPTPNGDLT